MSDDLLAGPGEMKSAVAHNFEPVTRIVEAVLEAALTHPDGTPPGKQFTYHSHGTKILEPSGRLHYLHGTVAWRTESDGNITAAVQLVRLRSEEAS